MEGTLSEYIYIENGQVIPLKVLEILEICPSWTNYCISPVPKPCRMTKVLPTVGNTTPVAGLGSMELLAYAFNYNINTKCFGV